MRAKQSKSHLRAESNDDEMRRRGGTVELHYTHYNALRLRWIYCVHRIEVYKRNLKMGKKRLIRHGACAPREYGQTWQLAKSFQFCCSQTAQSISNIFIEKKRKWCHEQRKYVSIVCYHHRTRCVMQHFCYSTQFDSWGHICNKTEIGIAREKSARKKDRGETQKWKKERE